MAIDYPTSRINPNPADFERGKPVIAGDSSDDKPTGFRGLSSATNFIYGRRVHALAALKRFDDGVIFSTTAAGSGGWVTATERLYVEIGAHVKKIKVVADVQRSGIQIKVNDSSSTITGTGSSPTAARRTTSDVVTLGVVTGTEIWVQLLIKQYSSGGTASLFGFVITEEELDSGDIP